MGLDAWVWCDCVEKGRLRVPHPQPELLLLDETGGPDIASQDPTVIERHDEWLLRSPCEHSECALVSHYLGNIGRIEILRRTLDALRPNADLEFPVLRTQVIHSGSHCGDFLAPGEVEKLRGELKQLRALNFAKLGAEEAAYWQEFLRQMDELADASLAVGKPIVF